MKKRLHEMQKKVNTLSVKVVACVAMITLWVLTVIAVILFFWLSKQTEKDYNNLIKATISNVDLSFSFNVNSAQNYTVRWYDSAEGTLCRLDSDYSLANHMSLVKTVENIMNSVSYFQSVYFINQEKKPTLCVGSSASYTQALDEFLLERLAPQSSYHPFVWQVLSRFKGEKDITLLSMYCAQPEKNFAGAVFANIDTEKLSKIIFPDSNEDTLQMFIIDKNGKVAVHSDSSLCGKNVSEQEWMQKLYESGEGSANYNADGASYTMTWMPSRIDGFHVVVQAEKTNYKIAGAAIIIFAGMLFAVVAIVLLALPSCLRIFKPFNVLVTQLRQNADVNDSGDDEVQFLNSYYEQLHARIQKLNVQEEKDFIVKNLLLGSQSETLKQLLLEHGALTEQRGYYIIIAYLGDNENNCSMKEYDAQKEVVSSLYCSALKDLGHYTYFDIGLRRMCFMLSESNDSILSRELLSTYVLQLKQKSEDIIYNTVFTMLSDRRTDSGLSCGVLFADLCDRMRTRIFINDAAGAGAAESQAEEETADSLCKQVCSLVKEGEKADYLELLQQLMHSCSNKTFAAFEDLITGLAIGVIRIRNQTCAGRIDESELRMQIQKQISCIATKGELLAWFEDLYDEASIQLHQVNHHSMAAQMEEAVDYVRTHYYDDNLNVNLLADKLNISARYFSKLFRDFVGCSALEYITKTRMEKAYDMLIKELGKDVGTIAQAVGYSNNGYFATAFKKYYGVSPSKLRDYQAALGRMEEKS